MKCNITMSGDNGCGEKYWKCGKPAKFIIRDDPLHPEGLFLCGLHARAANRVRMRHRKLPAESL